VLTVQFSHVHSETESDGFAGGWTSSTVDTGYLKRFLHARIFLCSPRTEIRLQYFMIWSMVSLTLRNCTYRSLVSILLFLVESSWNVMAHSDAWEGAVKGKQLNGVGIQYSSHYFGTWYIQHYYHYYLYMYISSSNTPLLSSTYWLHVSALMGHHQVVVSKY
jgi:hypothetical protein